MKLRPRPRLGSEVSPVLGINSEEIVLLLSFEIFFLVSFSMWPQGGASIMLGNS